MIKFKTAAGSLCLAAVLVTVAARAQTIDLTNVVYAPFVRKSGQAASPNRTATPGANPAPGSTATPVVVPVNVCSAEVHAKYVTQGPDGRSYPTWHPQIDPSSNCHFTHEHGDDPRTSLANSSMPAFGYIGAQAGMDEPHPGFKVFVINIGDRGAEDINNGQQGAVASTRMVAHMGTSGVKRFTERMHSLQYDLVKPDGHYMHIQGMADTGFAGDICQRDATLGDNDIDNNIGRVFFVKPDKTNCAGNGQYEIWNFRLVIKDRAEVNSATASFDPATMMDPTDLTSLLPTGDKGCRREHYNGPPYWYNLDKPTVFYTDANGNPGGSLRQEVSNHADIGIPLSSDGTAVMKLEKDHCLPGLLMPN